MKGMKRIMKNRWIWLVLVLSLCAAPLHAEDKTVKNEAELSYVDTSGNTETTTLKAKNTLTWAATEKLNVLWLISALYGESDDVRNAEQYATELRADYLLTEHFYSSLLAGWLQDKFAGIENKYYVGPACGYIFLNGPKHFFKSEVGVNYVDEEYIDDTTEDFFQGNALAQYEYAFTEKNKFTQTVKYAVDLEDGEEYQANSETALVCSLTDMVSLKTAYEVKYVNHPVPRSLDRTDTIFSTTLIINY